MSSLLFWGLQMEDRRILHLDVLSVCVCVCVRLGFVGVGLEA